MRNLITFLFFTILSITLTVSMLVGVAWLIDLKPKNLYLVWEICYSSLAVSLLLFILFGGRKNN